MPYRYNPETEQLEEYDDGFGNDFGTGTAGQGKDLTGNPFNIDSTTTAFQNSDGTYTVTNTETGGVFKVTQEQLASMMNPQSSGNASMANLTNAAYKEKLKDPSFVDQVNKFLGGTKFSAADLLKMGAAGIGGIAGAMGAGTATTKPTGYQGGIPDFVATQPMLTEPPPGRRPGSGGINYGTGVQYKDSKGNIVSDTSTPIADLYRKATQEGTYNKWNHKYGDIPKSTASAGINNLVGGNTSGIDINKILAQITKASQNVNQTPVASNTGLVTPQVVSPSVAVGGSNAPTGGFVTGGGNTGGEYGAFGSKAAYDKAVADETARRNAEQAELDKYHVSPDSLYYSAYMAATGQRKEDIKKDAKELADRIARRTAISQMGYAKDSFVGNGVLMGPNGPIYPNENEVGVTVTDASGRNRYQTKAEAAEIERKTQQYLMDHGNIIDPNKPFNVASTDAETQSVQAALAKLSQTPGDDKTRQAALKNFLKTTTFTPEQLKNASNGIWGLKDLNDLMDGNPNQPNKQTGYDDPNQAQTFVSKPEQPNIASSNAPAGGIANLPTTTPAPVVFGGIQNEPTTPLPGGQTSARTGYDDPNQAQTFVSYPQQDERTGYDDPNSGYQNPGTPNAPIDEYNPNDYFYSGGAKQGGLIKRHAEGGLTNLDHGGFVIPADVVSHFGNGSSSAGLELLAQKMGAEPIKGAGDGMSDSIPAAIDGREKALVANDEAYLSPQMVERLGDGDMDAGSRKLKNMMEQIRKARTGNKEQGKQINPNNFMPGGTVGYAQGGGIKSYAGTDPTGSLVQAGVTGTEQNLSNYAGPAITKMLGQAQALANTPYQAYTGPLTAGASGLQNLAFQNAGNLAPNGGMTTDFAQQAGNMNYTPTTSSFNEGFAQQYMNPYLQASLNPQLDEARRQSEITQQQNNAAMTKAGAFGGGRQAILTSENQRNLGTNQANITGAGYNTAYDKAMAQFNADQNRQMQENQFVNTSKLAGLNTGISGLSTANQMGINNLNTQATLGATQRGIESEGIAADKAQFEEARKDPYSKLQYLQSMFNGLPITAQNYTMSQPSAFQGAAGGATTLAQLLKNLNIGG